MSADQRPAAPPPGLRPPRRWSRLWWVQGPVLVLMIVALAVSPFVRADYTAIAPDAATPVQPEVRGHAVSHGPGQVLFVTVSEVDRPSYAESVIDWLKGDTAVYPRSAVLGHQTARQSYDAAVLDMVQSKQAAIYLALKHIGVKVKAVPDGAVIDEVSRHTPADGVLRPGDVVTAVDGKHVRSADELVAAVHKLHPGDTVHLTVRRTNESTVLGAPPGPVVHLRLTLGSFPAQDGQPADPHRPFIGVALQDHFVYHYPFKVDVDSLEVGGPSAGLAFTIGLIDKLTPGGILHGHRVATTGTIDRSGHVGPVGGVPQKTITVRRAGADLFIVPSAEYRQAKAEAGSRLRIAKADTLDQALRIIESLGH